MQHPFSRTELLLGADAMKKLSRARVAIFGIGGVGSCTVEALARSGIGALDVVDADTVDITNLNRQLIATHSTVGMRKVDAAKQRLLDINPQLKVTAHCRFFDAAQSEHFDFTQYDYVVDAIDTVTSKLALIESAAAAGIPIISSMGAGNKLDPTRFEVADIYSTSVCPLARVMRRELRTRGIGRLKVVYSREPAVNPQVSAPDEGTARRQVPGSVAFVPAVAGLIIAGEVVRDLIQTE